MQAEGIACEPGGIMEVAVWLCLPLLLRLRCNLAFVVMVLGNEVGVFIICKVVIHMAYGLV